MPFSSLFQQLCIISSLDPRAPFEVHLISLISLNQQFFSANFGMQTQLLSFCSLFRNPYGTPIIASFVVLHTFSILSFSTSLGTLLQSANSFRHASTAPPFYALLAVGEHCRQEASSVGVRISFSSSIPSLHYIYLLDPLFETEARAWLPVVLLTTVC